MMLARCVLCSAILIISCDIARADIGTPGMRRTKIIHRIAKDDDLQDYIVVVVHHRPYFAKEDEPKMTAVYAAFPVEVTGHYRQQAELIVAPRRVAGEFNSALALAEAPKTRTDIQRFPLSFDENVPAWYGNDFTINYRLVKDESGGCGLVRSSWHPYKQCCVVLVAIPLAIIYLGFRFVRWFFRKVKLPPAPPADPGNP